MVYFMLGFYFFFVSIVPTPLSSPKKQDTKRGQTINTSAMPNDLDQYTHWFSSLLLLKLFQNVELCLGEKARNKLLILIFYNYFEREFSELKGFLITVRLKCQIQSDRTVQYGFSDSILHRPRNLMSHGVGIQISPFLLHLYHRLIWYRYY